jgi:hypothetical protein
MSGRGFEAQIQAAAARLRAEAERDHAATRGSVDRTLGELQQLLWATGERVDELERRVDDLLEQLRMSDARTDLLITATVAGVWPGRPLPLEVRIVIHRAGTGRVICTRGTGPHHGLLALGVPALEAYARRWGWDLVVSTESHTAAGRQPSWGKLPLVRDLLDDHELVWWIDSDAIIVDLERDVLADLEPGRDLYVTEHEFTWDYGDGPQVHRFPNAGVFLLRGGDAGRALVDALWNDADSVDATWLENSALLDLLGYEVYPMRHVRETEWYRRTGWLPRAWNSLDDLDEDPAPALKHHAGNAPFPERYRRMLGDLIAVTDALESQGGARA